MLPVSLPLVCTVISIINGLFQGTGPDSAERSDQFWSRCTDVEEELLSFSLSNFPKLWSPQQWYIVISDFRITVMKTSNGTVYHFTTEFDLHWKLPNLLLSLK